MVPDPDTACVGLEYFAFKGDDLWTMADEDLVALATRELEQLGLARPEQVRRGYVVRVPLAYPVYDEEYAERVETIRGWLDPLGTNLVQVGRNGLHRYNNSDHSMLSAMRAVDNVVAGTAHDIWAVNVSPSTTRRRPTPTTSSPTARCPRPSTSPSRSRSARPSRRAPARRASGARPPSRGRPGWTSRSAARSARRRTKRAPGRPAGLVEHAGRRPGGARARARSPGRARSRPRRRCGCRAGSARRSGSPSSAGTPGPASSTAIVASVAAVGRRRPGPRCPPGAKRSALSSRMRRIAGDGPRVAAAPARPGGGSDLERDARPPRAALELRGDRPGQLAELDGLRAHRRPGVEAAEVQQLGREALQPRSLARAPVTCRRGIVEVEVAGRRGPRRAAPACPPSDVSGVRSSCDAVATKARRACLLPAQRGLHRRQRAARGRRPRRGPCRAAAASRRPSRVDPQRGRRRRRSRRDERRRQPEPSRSAARRGRSARRPGRPAHLGDGGRDVGEALAGWRATDLVVALGAA